MSMHVMRSVYKVKIIEVNICIYLHVCVGSMDNVDDVHLPFFIMTPFSSSAINYFVAYNFFLSSLSCLPCKIVKNLF